MKILFNVDDEITHDALGAGKILFIDNYRNFYKIQFAHGIEFVSFQDKLLMSLKTNEISNQTIEEVKISWFEKFKNLINKYI